MKLICRQRWLSAVHSKRFLSLTARQCNAKRYDDTLLLPKTDFPMRASATEREPLIQAALGSDLYHRVRQQRAATSNQEEFILHDGPPFANGDIHIGHVLNKVLKDIIVRSQCLNDRVVSFIPGWDCHGLPIEAKAVSAVHSTLTATTTDVTRIRTEAAKFATDAIQRQNVSFQRLAILADWQKPYITMTPAYEAAQLEVFVSMLTKGLIYRAFKPVQWSPVSQTALAEAEVEYQDHTSISVHVGFELDQLPVALPEDVERVCCLIWTTTPWTLLANQALAIGADISYVVVKKDAHALVVAEACLPSLRKALDSPLEILAHVEASQLAGARARHPLQSRTVPIVIANHVTADAGTGVVHMAPAHGKEDYFACLANGMGIELNLVDGTGRYNANAPEKYQGLEVLSDGNSMVIQELERHERLYLTKPHVHRYSYDWRTRTPLIQRATQQWFADVGDIKDAALASLADVKIHPEHGRSRLIATVQGRSEWCISRQRVWGMPIPILVDSATDEPLLDDKVLQHAVALIGEHGSNTWWEKSVEQLLPPGFDPKGRTFHKVLDTMDVWFDSGSSWHSVTAARHNGRSTADVYLEGSDQHRGWFQSSLLTKMAASSGQDMTAPFKTLLTHGFVLDDRGHKMSKSLDNGVDPSLVIEGGKNKKKDPAYGADTLRFWAASVDYTGDVNIGPKTLKAVSNNLRKIRNVSRFMLGNLASNNSEDAVSYDELQLVDQYLLHQLAAWQALVQQEYNAYNFLAVTQLVLNFLATDLSSFYFETIKDRLYADAEDSSSRRSACTVLKHVLHSLRMAVAPIVPHLAEELYFFEQGKDPSKSEALNDSVMFQTWPKLDKYSNSIVEQQFKTVRRIRDTVFATVEKARATGVVKGTMDATITLSNSDNVPTTMLIEDDHGDSQLLNVLMASKVSIGTVRESDTSATCFVAAVPDLALHVKVQPSDSHKCPRCWRHCSATPEALCGRCNSIVKE